MIISHKHQFIFVKPGKVAGSAIELGLESKLREDAIITPISSFNSSCDEDAYLSRGRNYFGFSEHMTPVEIKRTLPEEWKKYTKVTVSRNPWDMLISRWHWEGWLFEQYGPPGLHSYVAMVRKFVRTGNISLEQVRRKLTINKARTGIARDYPKGDFEAFLRGLPDDWTNDQYYFDEEGLIPDVVLRHENLQQDFDEFCSNYQIATSTLPRVKSKLRPKISTASYFTPHLVEQVAQRFQKQISTFGYSFPI